MGGREGRRQTDRDRQRWDGGRDNYTQRYTRRGSLDSFFVVVVYFVLQLLSPYKVRRCEFVVKKKGEFYSANKR